MAASRSTPIKTLANISRLRLNIMMHQNDRRAATSRAYDRFGVAPSITFGLGADTQLTLLLSCTRRMTTRRNMACRMR